MHRTTILNPHFSSQFTPMFLPGPSFPISYFLFLGLIIKAKPPTIVGLDHMNLAFGPHLNAQPILFTIPIEREKIWVIEKDVLGERNTQPGITAKETTKGSYHSYSIKEEENGREEVKLLIAQKKHPGVDHSTLSARSTNIPLWNINYPKFYSHFSPSELELATSLFELSIQVSFGLDLTAWRRLSILSSLPLCVYPLFPFPSLSL